MDGAGNTAPDLVPAWMVNEFTYCPRLFFLEWVQARWADNLDTVEGQDAHRRVEQLAGAAPLPDEGELKAAWSVQLSSTTLGLVAKVDLIEGAGGKVRPVDTQKGKPPDIAQRECPRCSLVGICLPDETNALAARSELPPRRLMPRDPAPRPLYVSEQGTYARKKGGRLEVLKDKEVLDSVRLLDVSQLCLFGNVQVSTQLLRELFAREVPICWFSYGGWFSDMGVGLPSKHVELRRAAGSAGPPGRVGRCSASGGGQDPQLPHPAAPQYP